MLLSVLFLLTFSPPSFSFTENTFSIQKKTSTNMQHLWSVDTVKTKSLRPSLMHNSSSLSKWGVGDTRKWY